MGQTRLMLASGSPRRRELLERLGLSFEVVGANLDESVRPGETPAAYVERLAREKALQVAGRHPGAVALGADTAVVVEDAILGKPADAEEARRTLRRLSGRTHAVFTGVAVQRAAAERNPPLDRAQVVQTAVELRPLSEAEIAWYVASGEPMDKAGSYAIQGLGAAWVSRIEGSPTNVIGLPLPETLALLREAGVALPWSARR